jgi:uncharacterized protein (TIGR00156 family)
MCRFSALLGFLAALGLAESATAQFAGTFDRSGMNVKAILRDPREDMPVVLRGIIVKKIYHEHYVFSDGTGRIRLDIDDDRFPGGVPVAPDMTIEISGRVDKVFLFPPEIEVERVSPVPAGY